jgi:hypothetical protein
MGSFRCAISQHCFGDLSCPRFVLAHSVGQFQNSAWDIPCNSLTFHVFRGARSDRSRTAEVQGDQKVSLHLMITIQKIGVQRLLITLYNLIPFLTSFIRALDRLCGILKNIYLKVNK